MGTSSSYRSPPTPRWGAFNRSLDLGLSLERISVQLFLAGEPEWRPAFNTPALATFAELLFDAHATLADRLAQAQRPATVIADVVAQARRTLFEEDFSVALPVAERALRTVLICATQRDVPLADASGAQAAEAWQQNRGEPAELVHRFVSEMFGQWAGLVAARDTARLVDPHGERSTATLRDFSDDLSQHVAEVVRGVPVRDLTAANVGANWRLIVDRVFEAGRRMDRADGP